MDAGSPEERQQQLAREDAAGRAAALQCAATKELIKKLI